MSVLVYFPDTLPNLYQLRQWYAPLRELDRRHRVGIVCLDSRTAKAVRAECDLPVLCCARIATLEDMVSRSDVALALYVNHNVRNLLPLRFASMLHVYLGHGESDKVSSASNQVKAYDFVLVAGAAGRDRLRRNLIRYDADHHVRTVGRPQLDAGATHSQDPAAQPSTRRPGGRPTVLYAPTWEGAQPSMAYSSVVSHGATLLRSLLDAGTYRIVYRPHPRTGANDSAYAAADQQLRALVQRYPSPEDGPQHKVDVDPAWDARHDDADVLISDISAVAGDWLTTGKPIIVTVPQATAAFVDRETVLGAVPGLRAEEAGGAAVLVGAVLDGGGADRRQDWVRHTMGDTSAGASIERFLTVCEELIDLRASELAARSARLASDTP